MTKPDRVRDILERMVCFTNPKTRGLVIVGLDKAEAAIRAEIAKELEGLKKDKIDIKKKMCCDGEYPRPCLYDVPEAETCRPQDKGIPKEKCSNYKDVQQEYYDFEEFNQAITAAQERVRKGGEP